MSENTFPDLDQVCHGIEDGYYDESLSRLRETIDQRIEVIKEQLRQKVKEIFGEEYDIVAKADIAESSDVDDRVENDESPEVQERAERAESHGDEERADNDEASVEDERAENSESSEEHERAMHDESSDQPERINPFEQRGAIIGGLSSGDIADS